MTVLVSHIAELEWANYAAMLPAARATPGLEVSLREEVILTSSPAIPTPDSNHACLLRATVQTADKLIAEVTGFFQERGLPVAIYLSPACIPDDLPQRLLESGFRRQPTEEAWLALSDVPDFDLPSRNPSITVREIAQDEALTFAEVFMTAFDLPTDFGLAMSQLVEPTIGLPNAQHYLAYENGQPIGTFSMLCHEDTAVLGSAGVIEGQRRSGVGLTLLSRALADAQDRGIIRAILQTEPDTWLGSFLRSLGFENVFTRACYILGHDPFS